MIETKTIKKGALIKKVPHYTPEQKTGSKALKEEAKETQTTTNKSVEYDTDTTSLVYMNAVTNVANFKFIEALVQANPEFETLFDAVYKTSIGWKGSDNNVHNVQLKSIIEAMELAMNQVAGTVGAV